MTSAPPELFTEDKDGRERLAVGAFIDSGTYGQVFKLEGRRRGQVVKRLMDPEVATQSEPKIRWMASNQPPVMSIRHQNRNYHQLAWPLNPVFDASYKFTGFIMPEIDLSASVGLEWIMQKSGREAKKITEHFRFRIHIARNLAALFDRLHSIGVCVIDVKPDNIRFYLDTGFTCLLDCDSFFPSDPGQPIDGVVCTPGYVLPEARQPDGSFSFGRYRVEQDRFALAVLIFRLLNEGLNPFGGKTVTGGTYSNDLEFQDRIDAGLYAYGLKPDMRVRPVRQSRHEWLATDTRRMFDRAFTSKKRPTAREWADHLAVLADPRSGRMITCPVNPEEHVHFGKGCGFCDAERKRADLARKSAQKAPRAATTAKPVSQPKPSVIPVTRPVVPPSIKPVIIASPPSPFQPWKIMLGLSAAILVIGALIGRPDDSVATSDGNQTIPVSWESAPWTAQIAEGRSINFRDGPGQNYHLWGSVSGGLAVKILGSATADDGELWYYTELSNGNRGFMSGRVFREVMATAQTTDQAEPAPGSDNASASTLAADAIAAGESVAPLRREAEPPRPTALASRDRSTKPPPQPSRPVEPREEPPVDCILPSGGEARVTLEICRTMGGTVYQ
jgi:serine/threonine protein kinase